jgi:hypothetical protein
VGPLGSEEPAAEGEDCEPVGNEGYAAGDSRIPASAALEYPDLPVRLEIAGGESSVADNRSSDMTNVRKRIKAT